MARAKIPGLDKILPPPQLGTPLNKAWRAKLFLNRATSGMPTSTAVTTTIEVPTSPNYTKVTRDGERKRFREIHRVKDTEVLTYNPLKPETKRSITNNIIIINPNTSPPTSIIVQGRPSQMEVTMENTWAAVKSMGRNNPFMIYTGGEDTITIDISWYSNVKSREDVISKCRLLESWTKANGYLSSPPVLYISWGNSNMFEDDSFILTSANYILSNFQNSYMEGERGKSSNYIDLKLLPNHATQTLTFKRVTKTNRTHEDIVKSEVVKKYL